MLHAVKATCTGLLVFAFGLAAVPARAQDPQADLRAQIEQLRQQLQALQEKVTKLEAAQPAAAPAQPPVTPPQPALPEPVQAPPGGAAPLTSKIFNPDMAVIGNFIGAAGHNSIEPMPALKLNEAEASFQAVVDPYARADFFLSASPEGLEVEEGFITFPTLPGGLHDLKLGPNSRQTWA